MALANERYSIAFPFSANNALYAFYAPVPLVQKISDFQGVRPSQARWVTQKSERGWTKLTCTPTTREEP